MRVACATGEDYTSSAMANPNRFEVFQISVSLVTVGPVTDPREEKEFEDLPQGEKDDMLTIYEKSPKGKIQFFTATVTDVSDENNAVSQSVSSNFFDTDKSDGGLELENLMPYVAAHLSQRYSEIAPVQKTEKRVIEWKGLLPARKDLRKLN